MVRTLGETPWDFFEVWADGKQRNGIARPTDGFVEGETEVGPGSHTFEFKYVFNPNNLTREEFEAIDPDCSNRTRGTVYIDNVYFVPFARPSTPGPTTSKPTSETTSNPTLKPATPKPSQAPATFEPTATATTTATEAPSQSDETLKPTPERTPNPSKRPTDQPTESCPATDNNCLPDGCEGACMGATGEIGAGSCQEQESCVNLSGKFFYW